MVYADEMSGGRWWTPAIQLAALLIGLFALEQLLWWTPAALGMLPTLWADTHSLEHTVGKASWHPSRKRLRLTDGQTLKVGEVVSQMAPLFFVPQYSTAVIFEIERWRESGHIWNHSYFGKCPGLVDAIVRGLEGCGVNVSAEPAQSRIGWRRIDADPQ